MAVRLSRRVDFPMLDLAGIAFYPRIYDLAHRFFEESWEEMCGVGYPHILQEMKIGFPVVDIKSEFHSPFRYGDTVNATIWISKVGVKSCTWQYRFHNQNDELLWSSEQVTVCVSMTNMESLPIPAELRTGLEACTNE
ncbi:MAG: acyl-CoA thioesterase [Candidatus Poseidoniaceae archaeon]|nr:acyl-CoA thioesterase [Candidatus Poseidoniaceae archaeon]